MRHVIESTANSVLTMQEHGDGSGVICQSTDISGALARNEALRKGGVTKTHDGDHFAAAIPIDLLQAWGMKKYGVGWEVIGLDDKKLDEFLSEHSKCRVYEGNI